MQNMAVFNLSSRWLSLPSTPVQPSPLFAHMTGLKACCFPGIEGGIHFGQVPSNLLSLILYILHDPLIGSIYERKRQDRYRKMLFLMLLDSTPAREQLHRPSHQLHFQSPRLSGYIGILNKCNLISTECGSSCTPWNVDLIAPKNY